MFRRFGALAAAFGLMGGALPAQAQSKVNAQIVAETPAATTQRMVRVATLGGQRVQRPSGFIWNARPKRGNRRGRSHWDYNR